MPQALQQVRSRREPLAAEAQSRDQFRAGGEADSDMALLGRYARTGSDEAFAQVVFRHAGWVYHVCRRGLRDAHLAEDATQAVFLLLAKKVASLSPQTHVAGWLSQACRYVMADVRKNRARYRRRQELARAMSQRRISDAECPEASPDPEVSAALDEALASLREGDRQTILMHFYEGLTLGQMAEQLGIAKEAAKKRVTRALSRLRQRLTGKGKGIVPVLPLAALLALLRSRAAEAAPPDVVTAVAKAVATPGFASPLAELMAEGVRLAQAMATTRLWIKLHLVAAKAVVVILVVMLLQPHRHGNPTALPAASGGATAAAPAPGAPGTAAALHAGASVPAPTQAIVNNSIEEGDPSPPTPYRRVPDEPPVAESKSDAPGAARPAAAAVIDRAADASGAGPLRWLGNAQAAGNGTTGAGALGGTPPPARPIGWLAPVHRPFSVAAVVAAATAEKDPPASVGENPGPATRGDGDRPPPDRPRPPHEFPSDHGAPPWWFAVPPHWLTAHGPPGAPEQGGLIVIAHRDDHGSVLVRGQIGLDAGHLAPPGVLAGGFVAAWGAGPDDPARSIQVMAFAGDGPADAVIGRGMHVVHRFMDEDGLSSAWPPPPPDESIAYAPPDGAWGYDWTHGPLSFDAWDAHAHAAASALTDAKGSNHALSSATQIVIPEPTSLWWIVTGLSLLHRPARKDRSQKSEVRDQRSEIGNGDGPPTSDL